MIGWGEEAGCRVWPWTIRRAPGQLGRAGAPEEQKYMTPESVVCINGRSPRAHCLLLHLLVSYYPASLSFFGSISSLFYDFQTLLSSKNLSSSNILVWIVWIKWVWAWFLPADLPSPFRPALVLHPQTSSDSLELWKPSLSPFWLSHRLLFPITKYNHCRPSRENLMGCILTFCTRPIYRADYSRMKWSPLIQSVEAKVGVGPCWHPNQQSM